MSSIAELYTYAERVTNVARYLGLKDTMTVRQIRRIIIWELPEAVLEDMLDLLNGELSKNTDGVISADLFKTVTELVYDSYDEHKLLNRAA